MIGGGGFGGFAGGWPGQRSRPSQSKGTSRPAGPPPPPPLREGRVPGPSQPADPERLARLMRIPGILVSANLSIHNRAHLFKRALDGYAWQSLPPEKWEIVLVDDMSTDGLAEAYAPYIGKINLRHVLVDHTKHPIFQKRNPNWEPGAKKNWYHTPAITLNVGFSMMEAPVTCLCHPEILHSPHNFERAADRFLLKRDRQFLFGTTYLGTQATNQKLDADREWTTKGWSGFLDWADREALEKYGYEKYWYTSFLPTAAAVTVGGVDFAYLNGVAGEDDDFRERVRLAGWEGIHDKDIEGFHQDHSHEGEDHRRRDTEAWARGLEVNRATFYGRKEAGFPIQTNRSGDWSARECVVGVTRYRVGIKEPVEPQS